MLLSCPTSSAKCDSSSSSSHRSRRHCRCSAGRRTTTCLGKWRSADLTELSKDKKTANPLIRRSSGIIFNWQRSPNVQPRSRCTEDDNFLLLQISGPRSIERRKSRSERGRQTDRGRRCRGRRRRRDVVRTDHTECGRKVEFGRESRRRRWNIDEKKKKNRGESGGRNFSTPFLPPLKQGKEVQKHCEASERRGKAGAGMKRR